MQSFERMKKAISLLLCLCMVLQFVPASVLAAEADGLCEHHTEHTEECGYVEGVSDCAYHCDVCLGHNHGDEVTEEDTEPAPVCDCGTDDPAIHATTCAVYVAPENPVCYCTEKCTETNIWCDVCGFDYTACTGTDTAVGYAEGDSVSYVDYTWNEESKTLSSETKSVDTYTEITSTTTEMTSGWYVVNGEVTVAERMTATGEVHLILADGAHLNASLGITVNEGNSLYIYGQSSDESTMGKLTATTTSSDAAIGSLQFHHAGTIVINGGNINASASEYGAGIGSGEYRGGYQITINAGVVTATSSRSSAAIGSGNNGGTGAVWGTVHSICINGGVVNATVTANGGAAIGGGRSFDGGDITITGGTVTATNKDAGAAIGGGMHGSGGNITITGGNVSATYTHSFRNGAAIGAGYNGESAGNILITGGTVTATSNRGCGIGVFSGDNGRIVILGGTVNASGSGTVHINAGASGSMMLVDGTTVTISGDFTLQTDFVLPEGYTLEISEGATLTIPEGVTLTLPEEYTLISNGTVNAVGTVNCITHKYVEGVCICGLECNHVGGTPTCTAPAVCTTCGTAYGEVDSTNHNWENGVCTYGCNTIHEPHDWSGKDGICTVCGATCTHTGGEATCTTLAVCDTCGKEYGELAAHTPDTNGKCTVDDCGYQYAAKVGDSFYETIHKALRAAEGINGCTLTLLDDITLTSMISYASYVNMGTFTLDLNGKTLSSNKRTLEVMGSADLTIRDSIGGGKIVSTDSSAVYLSGGKLTIESGTFEGSLDGVFLSGTSTLIVKGGTFVGSRATITGFGSNVEIDLTAVDPSGLTLKNNGSGTFAPKLPEGYGMVDSDGKLLSSLSAEQSATVHKHEYKYTDLGNRNHQQACSCGLTTGEPAAHSTEKDENKANCQHGDICDLCGASYGEVDKTNHDETVAYVNGFCPNCDAYEPAKLVNGVYEISNAGQLYWFADKVTNENAAYGSADAILTCDIRVNEGTMTEASTDARVWTPIGKVAFGVNIPYTGTFEGNGKTVSGLYFNDTSANFSVGLFSLVGEGGTVRNVGIADSYLCGSQNIGAVVGINYGTVTGCYNTGTVSCESNVGGVVGGNNGTVENCYNSGTVSGRSQVGGVVGYNTGTVSDCHNSGSVNGSSNVGGVVGSNDGTVTGCYNTGTVSGESNVGGVVGGNNGTVENCYNSDTVSGRSQVGGVAGENWTTVTNCYNTGTVSGEFKVGAVVGINYGTVSNCYFDSTVHTGNAIGTNSDTATDVLGKTTEQFASGEVAYLLSQGENGDLWGQDLDNGKTQQTAPTFTGAKVYQGYISCGGSGYTNSENASAQKPDHTETATDNGDGTHKVSCTACGAVVVENEAHTTEKDENKATCAKAAVCDLCGTSYGAVDTTNHDSSVEYENGFCPNGCYEPAELVDNVYQISNAGNLYWFADKVTNENETYGSVDAILTADITVNENVLAADGTANAGTFRVWTPIGKLGRVGNQRVEYPYTGTFEGNGKTVSGLYFNDTSAMFNVGLFSVVGESGKVQNVGIADSYLCGSSGIGAVAGSNGGTVTGCHNTGTVSGTNYVGGVVGGNSGTVTGCHNTGTVSGTSYVGGVVGYNYNNGDSAGTIEDSYNTGTVSGDSNVGGVVGENLGPVTGCYNNGTVSGTTNVGGVAGDNWTTVTNCYNTGTVSGESNVGGVVGWNTANHTATGTVIGCYFDSTVYTGDAIGTNNGTATDVAGKSTEQFKSGEVAYLLSQGENGGIWGQDLDNGKTKQPAPTFTGAKVYQGYTSCGDTAAKYTNDSSVSPEKPGHTGEITYAPTADGTQHVATYGCCGAEFMEAHTFDQNDAGEWVCDCTAKAVASVTIENLTAYYANFADAVTMWAEHGDILTLLADVSYDSTINLGVNVSRTFVGGDYTLDLGSNNIVNYGTLTIQSGTIKTQSDTAIAVYGPTTINSDNAELQGTSFQIMVHKPEALSITGTGCDGWRIWNNYNTQEAPITIPEGFHLEDEDGNQLAANDKLPAWEITVIKANHVHNWSYTADGSTITATCEGTIGSCSDTEQSFTLNASDAGYSGNPVEAEVTRDGTDLSYTLRYTGTNYDSADAPTNAGDYTVTMTVGDKSVSDTFTISPKNIANCTASLSQNSFTYDGKAPALTVSVVDNGVGSTPLAKDTDYTVGTVQVNAGDHKLTVTGKGNYTGTAQLDYTITTKSITPTVEGVDASYTYTGQAIQPTVTVKNGDTVLVKGTDYDVSYGENTTVANGGSVTVTLKGNYSGEKTVTFTIAPAPVTVTGQNKTVTYTGTDIDLRELFSIDENAGAAEYTIINLTGDGSFTAAPYLYNVTKAGTFTVQVKTAATENYCAGEATAVLTVSKAEPSIVWNSGYFNSYGNNMYITAHINGVDGDMITGTAVATVYDADGKELNSVSCTKTDSTGTYFFNNLNEFNGTYLAPGIYSVYVSFQGNDTYNPKTIKLVEYKINKKALTVTANDSTIIYGEEPSNGGVAYKGFAKNEDASVLGGELTYSYGYEQFGDVGTYAITPAGLISDNYEITFANGTLTVDAKAITVTADAASKTYGEDDPELTYKVEGLVNGDKLTGKLSRAAGEDVGTYAIEQNTLTAGNNYTITYTGAELTINKKPVSYAEVSILKNSLPYTGKEQTVELNVPDGATYSVTEGKLTATDVGMYEFTIEFTGNYSGTFTLGWQITKVAPEFTAPTANTLYYTGKAQNLVAAGTTNHGTMVYSLTENGEFIETIPTGTDSGTYTVYYKVLGDKNHTDTDVQSVEVVIDLAKPQFTVPTGLTAVYGDTLAKLTLPQGFTWQDAATTSVGDAGENTFMVTFTPEDIDNYATVKDIPVTVTVSKQQLVISQMSWNVPETLIYNGKEQSVSLGGNLPYGVVVETSGHKATNAGTYTATASFSLAKGYDAKNYEIVGNANPLTAQWEIQTKDISGAEITLGVALTYNGTEQTQRVASAKVDGLTATWDISGNTGTEAGDYTLTITGNGNFSGTATKTWSIAKKDISDAEITLGTALTYNGTERTQTVTKTEIDGLTVTGAVSGNTGTDAKDYTLTVTGNGNFTGTATKTWSIAKAPLTVTARSRTITYGDTPAANVVEYSGFVGNENETLVKGQLSYTYNYEQFGNVGTYTITPKGLTADNYEITFVDGTLTVDAKAITVTADAASKTYGEDDPELTYKVEGLVNGDKLTGKLSRAAGEDVGTYAIEQNTLTAGDNYTITYTGADLTINAKAIAEADVELKGSLTYTGEEQTQTVTVTEGITYTVTGNTGVDAGEYTLSIAGTGNFTGTVTKAWSIAKKDISGAKITLGATLTYNGSAQAQTITSVTVDGIPVTYTVSGNTQTNVGGYVLTVTGTGNFTGTGTAYYTINPDTSGISGLTPENVTSQDKAALEELLEALDNMDLTNATQEHKKALEELKALVEDLLDVITQTEESISNVTETVTNITPETATSADKEDLIQAVETIDDLLASGNLTAEERSALEDAKSTAEALIAVIDAVQESITTENTEIVDGITSENVQLEDKENLENAKADLEQVLEDNGSNLTEEEKEAIQAEIDRIDGAIESIEKVEDVTGAVIALPEVVTPGNASHEAAVEAAAEAYESLTDHEKSLVDEEIKAILDEAVKALEPCDGEVDCPSLDFSDLNINAWYHEAIDYVLRNGIMQGDGTEEFKPEDALTRGMIVQILYNMEGKPSVSGEDAFTDTEPDAWYSEAVLWASQNGIVQGYGNGKYGPEESLTREQMAAILCRYAEYKGANIGARASLQDFTDRTDASAWAEDYVKWAVANGIINGFGDGTLRPTAVATRAQVAQIILNYFRK